MTQAINEVLSTPLPHAPRPLAFSVIRVPYFLEPDFDETLPYVESNRQRLLKKWGGTAGWEEQKNRHDLKGRGEEAGIPYFNLDRLASNTMASHRLIQYIGKAYGLNASEAIYDLLNVYYFVDGHALNDRPKLAHVVSEELNKVLDEVDTVPTPDDILDFLNGDEGRKEIEDALRTLQEFGVSGIPKFIIEGERMVDGAARSDVFVRIFREIEKRGRIAREPIFGNILGIPKEVIERGSHTAEVMVA